MFEPASSNRIEMLGVPGSGKSWLWQRLVKRLGDAVLTPEQVLASTARRLGGGRATYGDERMRSYVDLCLSLFAEGDGDVYRRATRISWLMRDLHPAAVAAQLDGPRIAFLDEGPAQRGISVAASYSAPQAPAERYFVAMPPPLALVVVRTALEVAEARIRTRPPTQLYHLEEHANSERGVEIGTRVLAERGVAIVEADGARLADQPRSAAEVGKVVARIRAVLAEHRPDIASASPERRTGRRRGAPDT